MTTLRTQALVPLAVLAMMLVAGCGGGEDAAAVNRAADRCTEQAKSLDPAVRSSIEAACEKARAYCSDAARRREPLCQQFLARYR